MFSHSITSPVGYLEQTYGRSGTQLRSSVHINSFFGIFFLKLSFDKLGY